MSSSAGASSRRATRAQARGRATVANTPSSNATQPTSNPLLPSTEERITELSDDARSDHVDDSNQSAVSGDADAMSVAKQIQSRRPY